MMFAIRHNWLSFALAGIAVQAIGIAFYALLSQDLPSAAIKLIVAAGTCIATVLLLALRLRRNEGARSLLLASAILSFGYIVAFHLVGVLAFRGLLRDFDIASPDYFLSLIRVFAVTFVGYIVCSVVVLAGLKLPWSKLREHPR